MVNVTKPTPSNAHQEAVKNSGFDAFDPDLRVPPSADTMTKISKARLWWIRLYEWSKGLFAIFIVLSGIALLPSAVQANALPYEDVVDWGVLSPTLPLETGDMPERSEPQKNVDVHHTQNKAFDQPVDVAAVAQNQASDANGSDLHLEWYDVHVIVFGQDKPKDAQDILPWAAMALAIVTLICLSICLIRQSRPAAVRPMFPSVPWQPAPVKDLNWTFQGQTRTGQIRSENQDALSFQKLGPNGGHIILCGWGHRRRQAGVAIRCIRHP